MDEEHACSQVEGYPTIVFYPRSNKRGVEYDGSRDEHDIIQFVTDVRAGVQTGFDEDATSMYDGTKLEL